MEGIQNKLWWDEKKMRDNDHSNEYLHHKDDPQVWRHCIAVVNGKISDQNEVTTKVKIFCISNGKINKVKGYMREILKVFEINIESN